MSGSYLVRLTSNNRVSGTLSNFSVDVSGFQQLQNVTAMRLHTISFPNVQGNITASNNTIALGTQTLGIADGRLTETVPAGSVFRAAVVPFGGGIWRSAALAFTVPVGAKCSDLAAVLTASMTLDAGFNAANAFVAWNPGGYFTIDYAFGGFQLIIDAPGGVNAADPVFYRQMGLASTGGPVGVPHAFNQLIASGAVVPYFTVTVPEGQYTGTTFATAFNASIVAQSLVVPIAAALVDEDFRPRYQLTSVTPVKYYSTLDTFGVSSLARPMGISQSSGYVTSFTTQVSPNLRGLTVASLHSQTFSMARCVQARDAESDNQAIALSVVTEIPVAVEWGGWVTYQPQTDQPQYYNNPRNITSINFALRDPTYGGAEIELCEPGLHIMLEVVSS